MNMILGIGMAYIIILCMMIASMMFLSLKGKREKYNKIFLLCELAVTIWCGAQILIMFAKTEEEIKLAYGIGNLGICFVGPLLYYFSILYTKKTANQIETYLPVFVGFFHYIMMLTNDFHHLYYKMISIKEVQYGCLFYSNVIMSYFLVAVSIIHLYRQFNKMKKGNKEKIFVIASLVIPLFMNLIYLFFLHKRSIDITAIGFACSVILMSFATIKYKFMEMNITAFDVALSNILEGVIIFDKTGMVTFYNQAAKQLLGKSDLQFKQLSLSQVEDDMKDLELIEEVEKQNHLYKDEKGRYLEVEIYDKRYKAKNYEKYIIYIIKDMSKYYEVLEQTKQLVITNEKLALEKERNRIAQEVHDTVGHTLTMIQSYMKLAEVSHKKNENEKLEEFLIEAKKLSSDGIKELRESINQLRKEAEQALVTQGVLQLADHVKEIEVKVTIQGEDSEKYSHLSRVIYDTVRESITNTLKYAHASKMEIIMKFQEKGIEITIADDGLGCETIKENNGISGMRNRIKEVSGNIRFLTAKGEGFLTKIKIPVH